MPRRRRSQITTQTLTGRRSRFVQYWSTYVSRSGTFSSRFRRFRHVSRFFALSPLASASSTATPVSVVSWG
jgi:hypothetical protein